MAERNNAYAEALFEIASETGKTDRIAEGLTLLTELFDQNPEYTELLSSPAVPRSERESLIHAALDGAVEEDLISFLLLLCEGRHLGELAECAAEYQELYRYSQRTAVADVRSAVALTQDEQVRLRERLEKISGKSVTLRCTVDPALLGGITVNLDGTVYDGSIRRRMDDMKKVMEE